MSKQSFVIIARIGFTEVENTQKKRFKGYQKYLYGINPFSYVQKALLTGYVIEQENAIGPPEVGFCDALEPAKKEQH